MQQPLISIIIPCYNIAPYLGRCLDSVLAQTYQNIEVICVNDGSKDETGKILDEYAQKDSRIKVIHKENGGVTSARFAGLDVAKGEWIGFVDGDDIIDENMYERLYNNVTDETDISHCGFKKLLPDGSFDYVYGTGEKIEQDQSQGIKDLLEAKFIEPGLWNKLYRSELFEEIQDWLDVSIKINEDTLMNFYLFSKARRSVYEDFCPYTYILRESSAAASFNANKLYDPIKVLDIISEGVKEDEALQGVVVDRIVYFLVGGASLSTKRAKEFVKPFRKYARKRLKKELKKILRGKYYTKRMKMSALWVCIWPASYRWMHAIYHKKHYKYKDVQKEYKWL